MLALVTINRFGLSIAENFRVSLKNEVESIGVTKRPLKKRRKPYV